MTQSGTLVWHTGAGWLVLAGGGDWQQEQTAHIDAAALGWANLNQPIAILTTAGTATQQAEALLDYLVDLGGPTGYVVPLYDAGAAQQPDICDMISQAGLIYILDGPDILQLVAALRESAALAAINQAFLQGATVLGFGAGAAALGAWVFAPEDASPVQPGWGWLPNAAISPHFVDTVSAPQLRDWLAKHPDQLGLGIPDGLALGLGPSGRVVTVGEGEITVIVQQQSSSKAD